MRPRYGFSLVALLMTAVLLSADEPRWYEFKSPDGRFTAQFPSEPEDGELSTQIGPFRLSGYQVGGPRGSFMLLFGESPVPSAALDDAKKSRLAAGYAELLVKPGTIKFAEKKIQVGNHPGVEFSSQSNEKGKQAKVFGRLYIVGSSVYILLATELGPRVPTEKDARKFLESFRLHKVKE